jgi:hypothetical protein
MTQYGVGSLAAILIHRISSYKEVVMTYRWPGCFFILPFSLLIAGCITNATIELTKAPFDATTDLAGGVSGAISEFTEPTREILSSTTPGAWFTDDGPVKAEHKVRAFTVYGFHSLKADIARGGGEYLTSLADLLGIPQPQRPGFYRYMQAQYSKIYTDRLTAAETLNRVLAEVDHARQTVERERRI